MDTLTISDFWWHLWAMPLGSPRAVLNFLGHEINGKVQEDYPRCFLIKEIIVQVFVFSLHILVLGKVLLISSLTMWIFSLIFSRGMTKASCGRNLESKWFLWWAPDITQVIFHFYLVAWKFKLEKAQQMLQFLPRISYKSAYQGF